MRRVAALVTRRPRTVVAIWLVLAASAAPLAIRGHRELAVSGAGGAGEAAAVDRVVAERFSTPFARYAVLVVTGVPAPDSPAGRAALEVIIAGIDTVAGIAGTWSFLTSGDTLFRGRAGGTFVIAGLDAASTDDEIIPRLHAATAAVHGALIRTFPGASLRWGGRAAIDHDIRIASAHEARAAELRVLPLTLLLLLRAFGGVIASVLPLLVAGIAILIALGTAALLNTIRPLSVLLQNMTTMIGLGAGIDYALLTVSRYREARDAGNGTEVSVASAVIHAGRTIAFSGAVVVVGLGALLLVPLNELQSVGVGGVLVIALSVLLSTHFLGALLALLGTRIDARTSAARVHAAPARTVWRRWGEHVVRRPLLVLIVAGLPLGLLAWQTRRLDARLPRGDWLPRGVQSTQAVADLETIGRRGIVNSIRVLIEFPASACATTPAGWQALRRASGVLADDVRIVRVVSATSLFPLMTIPPASLDRIPASDMLLSRDGCASIIEAIPHDSLDLRAATALVRDLRRQDLSASIGIPEVHVRIGGAAALNADNEDAISTATPRIVALVVAVTLFTLMIGFRSLLVPIKAIALNLLSIAAALGAVVIVFQDGYGARLVGLDGALHGVFPATPVLIFCVVFGLSMDYEVFLVARVAEARRTVEDPEAIIVGLERTGGVISNAAIIMIVVFGAFAMGSFLFVKILGFALAVAVLVDATVVRLAIGPALLTIAGRWNWWPGQRHDVP